MPKLLQLNVTANWGSTGKIAEGIGLAALARGWESAIVYGRMMNPSASQLVKVGSQADVYAHYARYRYFDGEGLGSRRSTLRLINWIEKYAPDVVHLHNIHDHWLNYPELLKYLKSSGIKVVWTFHDCWAFTGGCAHFVQYNCQAWKRVCEKCPAPRAPFDHTTRNFRLRTSLVKALGDQLTIVSVSHWLDSLVGQSAFKDMVHCVIHNGVDTSVFRPRDVKEVNDRYHLTGKTVLLGISSVWPIYKGLADYIALRARLPESFVIVIVGLEQAKIKSLPKGIVVIPRTNSVNELAELYSRADAVMSLSKAETFGMTLVEGLACGTPSIGYAATAIKEILSPDIGIAVEPGNVENLSIAARLLASGRVSFDPIHCREYVETNFHQETQFNKYVDLYEYKLSQSLGQMSLTTG